MSDPRTTPFKLALARVNELLNDEWAPIGGAPSDEYESYAVRVLSMLASGSNELEIAEYLAGIGASLAGEDFSGQSREVASRLVKMRGDISGIAS